MKPKNDPIIAQKLIFSKNAIWGLFPVISVLSVQALSPFFAAGISTLIAAIFFGGMMTFRKIWHELAQKKAWIDMLISSFLVGVLVYGIAFWALQHTSAGNASILFLTEIGFSFLIFGILFRTESITQNKIIGAGLMILGAILILFENRTQLHLADAAIIAAAALANAGNFFAKRAMKWVSSTTLLFFRSVFSGFALILIGVLAGNTWNGLGDSWIFLAINGLLLMGFSKILWLEAIARTEISHAVSFGPLATVFTLIFAFLILGEIPSLIQILGFLPMAAGVWFLTRTAKKSC